MFDIPWGEEWFIVIISVFFGALIGFLSSVGLEIMKNKWRQNERREHEKTFFSAIIKEIENGIHRAEWFIEAFKEGKISFSKIYVGFWKSTCIEFSKITYNPEILALINEVYYIFELINYPIEINQPSTAVAFAREYIHVMKEKLKKLRSFSL